MTQQQSVAVFNFQRYHSIEADTTGTFKLKFGNGLITTGRILLDVGEIDRLEEILSSIEAGRTNPQEDDPEVFWRTDGSKVIEVYLSKDTSGKLANIVLREGGAVTGTFRISATKELLRHIRVLTEGAPYERIVRLLDIVEEGHEERLFHVDRFPLNNRDGKSPITVEKTFRRETTKTVDIQASFGIGLDYFISTSLQSRFGLTEQQRLTEEIKVTMQAMPGEHKQYVIIWTEKSTCGHGIFDINGIREEVPFKLKTALIPDVQQELVVQL